MSFPRGSSSTRDDPRRFISVRSKLENRFYEPVVLLVGLNRACIHDQPTKAPDLSSDLTQSPEHAFHNFVNKLGQLCDSERGGNTVTAFVVLKFPDRIQYRFASNQRVIEDYVHARKFITGMLQTLADADDHELQGITSHILRESLSFNRPRVESYIRILKEEAGTCINACIRDDTAESNSILKELEKLQVLQCVSDDAGLDHDHFPEHCEGLIKAIDQIHKSRTDTLIRNKTNEGRMNESICWCELRHAMGRLSSYLRAAETLVSTRRQWPELFEDFEVCYIASSIPAGCPLRNRKRPEKISADDILGRMTSDAEKLAKYRSHAQDLQMFDLDNIIRRCVASRKFKPIVHAEVLLLESLENDGGTHPFRFFGSYKYIGCSKPTCRLCDYYFSVHQSGVRVRSSHPNLYHNWRMPDVYEDQGHGVEKENENIMNKMLIRIREDTFRTLSEKVSERKQHDSNTEPTYPVDNSILGWGAEDTEYLASGFGTLAIQSRGYEAAKSSSEVVFFDRSNEFEARATVS